MKSKTKILIAEEIKRKVAALLHLCETSEPESFNVSELYAQEAIIHYRSEHIAKVHLKCLELIGRELAWKNPANGNIYLVRVTDYLPPDNIQKFPHFVSTYWDSGGHKTITEAVTMFLNPESYEPVTLQLFK